MGVKLTKIIGYILIFSSVIVIMFIGNETYRIYNLISQENIISSTIINEHFAKDATKRVYYYSIKYTVDRKEYTIETKSNSSIRKYIIGNKIEVFYEKNNPNNAILNNWDETYGLQIKGYFLFSLLLIAGLTFVFFNKKIFKFFTQKK